MDFKCEVILAIVNTIKVTGFVTALTEGGLEKRV